MINRRAFCAGGMAAGLLAPAGVWASARAACGEIEARAGGRLGVYAMARGRVLLSWRAGERFAFCSSFKLSLAALVLDGAERGLWRLDEKLRFGARDVLPNSPALQAHLGEGALSLADLAEAAQTLSDNGATNLLLRRLGGPGAVTAFWRRLGDRVSRLDDKETALNRVPPGSLRNTTTPMAMAGTVQALLGRGAISAPARDQLKRWMQDTQTGARRLRAGLPVAWWAGDKTGTGLPADLPGTYADLAWVEPQGTAPIAIAAFYQPPRPTPDGDPQGEAVLAQVAAELTRIVMAGPP